MYLDEILSQGQYFTLWDNICQHEFYLQWNNYRLTFVCEVCEFYDGDVSIYDGFAFCVCVLFLCIFVPFFELVCIFLLGGSFYVEEQIVYISFLCKGKVFLCVISKFYICDWPWMLFSFYRPWQDIDVYRLPIYKHELQWWLNDINNTTKLLKFQSSEVIHPYRI